MTPSTGARLHLRGMRDGRLIEAVVSRRAAALRLLTVDGLHLVEPTASTEPAPGAAGAVLAPWPNRVEGARWTLDGVERRLPVGDPENGHANHGLLLDRDWDVAGHDDDALTLRTVLEPSPGYPFRLELTTRYALDPGSTGNAGDAANPGGTGAGVSVQHDVVNRSAEAAPFALGAHPYLCIGDRPGDELTLTIEADRALVLDEGWIPRGERPVEGTRWDLRGGRRLTEIDPHSGYTALRRRGGQVVHRLEAPDGTAVELWADAVFGWVQVYRAPQFATDRGTRSALAVEPMSAPPNALRTGRGLHWIGPGEAWSARWGIRLGPEPSSRASVTTIEERA
ncbi:aldose 1-epimerase family protein [Herbiconiux sp. VKM Ac-1786]|uniref:aldose 1-epimerase family protein n=1 Tax=Herbiconiux sp. VKM Ac-1786 TaxID=2783824 RepID=UPI00188DBA95|nr:aldose 1-epimerase family protein [Herbiconiux sp. VKM Ac-1786]MBF4572401.1 aldose 1-epimerase family protein [Herbiconiux sp. VKM Ac-1786]